MTPAECFGANLKRARRRADLSQEELAFRAGLHRTAIGLLELGQRAPRMATLAKLMAGAEASADELMEGIAWVPPSGLGGSFVVSDSHHSLRKITPAS